MLIFNTYLFNRSLGLLVFLWNWIPWKKSHAAPCDKAVLAVWQAMWPCDMLRPWPCCAVWHCGRGRVRPCGTPCGCVAVLAVWQGRVGLVDYVSVYRPAKAYIGMCKAI